jgi:hypothetical protein
VLTVRRKRDRIRLVAAALTNRWEFRASLTYEPELKSPVGISVASSAFLEDSFV